MATTQQYSIGTPFHVTARHPEHKSHNRMHADGLPQKLGFRGAFVLGVSLYGYMSRALVASLGEAWLSRGVIEVKFLKPVCEGDTLRIETRAIADAGSAPGYEVSMYNETAENQLSATMRSTVPVPFPAPDPTSDEKPNEWEGPVTERRTWNSVVVGKAYRSYRATLSAADNAYWTRVLDDDLPIYSQGDHPPLHPAHVLRQVQLGYNNQFIGESAVHSSTRAVIHRILRVGDPVHLLTVPLKKWEKKDNHWLTIYCAVRSGDELCAEIFHTQIIRLRGAEGTAASKQA